MADEKIKHLQVTFKNPPNSDVFLKVAAFSECLHGQYEVDSKLSEVKCTKCGEKMNPMHVLNELACNETAWHRARESYQHEMKRLEERSRTKCQHCGKLTRISNA